MNKYKCEITKYDHDNGKYIETIIVLTEKQILNKSTLLSNLNEVEDIGSGHDGFEITKDGEDYRIELDSYCGGPYWRYHFQKI